MTSWVVHNGEGLDDYVVATPGEAVAAFDDIDQRVIQPCLVGIHPEGDPYGSPTFLLGAGHDQSFFCVDGEFTPGEGDEPTAWWYGNQDAEYPAGILIPKQTARDKLLEALAA